MATPLSVPKRYIDAECCSKNKENKNTRQPLICSHLSLSPLFLPKEIHTSPLLSCLILLCCMHGKVECPFVDQVWTNQMFSSPFDVFLNAIAVMYVRMYALLS